MHDFSRFSLQNSFFLIIIKRKERDGGGHRGQPRKDFIIEGEFPRMFFLIHLKTQMQTREEREREREKNREREKETKDFCKKNIWQKSSKTKEERT